MKATPAVPGGAPTQAESTESISFEQALDELDALVRRMESGQLSLDDSIAAYRRGAELARFCQSKLANAEQEIKRLEGDLLKPLDVSELKVGLDRGADTE
ncbi:MAG: exodeoxyribonuclease VII small subunit [Burkholderiaceae bacterium]